MEFFYNKVEGTSLQVLFFEFWEAFQNSFFIKHLCANTCVLFIGDFINILEVITVLSLQWMAL